MTIVNADAKGSGFLFLTTLQLGYDVTTQVDTMLSVELKPAKVPLRVPRAHQVAEPAVR